MSGNDELRERAEYLSSLLTLSAMTPEGLQEASDLLLRIPALLAQAERVEVLEAALREIQSEPSCSPVVHELAGNALAGEPTRLDETGEQLRNVDDEVLRKYLRSAPERTA